MQFMPLKTLLSAAIFGQQQKNLFFPLLFSRNHVNMIFCKLAVHRRTVLIINVCKLLHKNPLFI